MNGPVWTTAPNFDDNYESTKSEKNKSTNYQNRCFDIFEQIKHVTSLMAALTCNDFVLIFKIENECENAAIHHKIMHY